MATTTSNFSWPIPQSTDLVKDGATAIASLGSGIDTSMAELKGGTTGQILSKTSGTDMDFTWVTPNPGDITGVTAGTGITGGGTSGDVTVSIDPTYYLLANQTRRNSCLNSNFSVSQRGTSFALSSASWTYTLDRWAAAQYTTAAATVSQSTSAPTGFSYSAKVGRNNGATTTGAISFRSAFETSNSILFANKTVTVSFYAKAGANYSSASSNLIITLFGGTGTDQSISAMGASWTGNTTVGTLTQAITTTWTRYSFTTTVGSTITQLGLEFLYTPAGTAGADDNFYVTGVQLELGSVANTYMPNQPTYQGELAACQRYYWRTVPGGGTTEIGYGIASSTTAIGASVRLPVTMRTSPSALEYSTVRFDDTVNVITVSSLTLSANGTNTDVAYINGTVTGATQYRPYFLSGNGGGFYIGLTAEL